MFLHKALQISRKHIICFVNTTKETDDYEIPKLFCLLLGVILTTMNTMDNDKWCNGHNWQWLLISSIRNIDFMLLISIYINYLNYFSQTSLLRDILQIILLMK